MKSRLTAVNLEKLNNKLDKLTMDEIIQWAADTIEEGKIAVLSAFQMSGCALCHAVYRLGLNKRIDVVFVDTGVNFPETLETIERMKKEYDLNIISLHPEQTMAEQTKELGVLYLSKTGQERCCHLRKKVPLQQMKGKYEAMLSSLRRSSGGRRSDVDPIVLDTELNLLRIHPMLNISHDELDEYIAKHEVITNPLHEQGFPTVSCNRCTTPVLPGEPERSGRWRHLEHEAQYCNINPSDRQRDGENEDFVELSYETAEKILHFDI